MDIDINTMFICRIAWMEKYQGIEDSIGGTAKFLQENGWGYEGYNFLPYEGKMYGYVQPPPKNKQYFKPKISIENLGASAVCDSVSNVFIVWVAKESINESNKVVGYYKNATVLRKIDRLIFSKRLYPDNILQTYRMYANESDCRLLNMSERKDSPLIYTTKSANPKGSGIGTAQYLFPSEENINLRQEIYNFLVPYL